MTSALSPKCETAQALAGEATVLLSSAGGVMHPSGGSAAAREAASRIALRWFKSAQVVALAGSGTRNDWNGADLDLIVVTPVPVRPSKQAHVLEGLLVDLNVFSESELLARLNSDRVRNLNALADMLEGSVPISGDGLLHERLQGAAREIMCRGPHSPPDRDQVGMLAFVHLFGLVKARGTEERLIQAMQVFSIVEGYHVALLGGWPLRGKHLFRRAADVPGSDLVGRILRCVSRVDSEDGLLDFRSAVLNWVAWHALPVPARFRDLVRQVDKNGAA